MPAWVAIRGQSVCCRSCQEAEQEYIISRIKKKNVPDEDEPIGIVTIATNIGLGLGPVLTGAVQTGLNSAASNKVKDALNGALSALKDLAKGEAPPKGAKSDKESTAALVAALNSAVDKPDGFLAQKGGEKLGKALGETIGRFATYGTNPFKAG